MDRPARQPATAGVCCGDRAAAGERVSGTVRALTCASCGTLWLAATRSPASALASLLGWWAYVAMPWTPPWRLQPDDC